MEKNYENSRNETRTSHIECIKCRTCNISFFSSTFFTVSEKYKITFRVKDRILFSLMHNTGTMRHSTKILKNTNLWFICLVVWVSSLAFLLYLYFDLSFPRRFRVFLFVFVFLTNHIAIVSESVFYLTDFNVTIFQKFSIRQSSFPSKPIIFFPANTSNFPWIKCMSLRRPGWYYDKRSTPSFFKA